MTRTVLITGGAGFIGSHLAQACAAAGEKVRVLDNLANGRIENLKSAQAVGEVTLLRGDVRDPKAVTEALAGVDVVYHLAALGSVINSIEDPGETHDVNVNGSLVLFEAMRAQGVKRLVVAASCAAYGDTLTLPLDESMAPRPLSPYAVSKLAQEAYALAFAQCYGFQSVSLRFFNVYGPRQDARSPYAAVIPKFFEAAQAGVSPRIFGDGRQTRDFVYVGDVVAACRLAAKLEGACGQTLNVCTGQSHSVLELAQAVAKACGRPDLQPTFEPARPGEVKDSCGNPKRAQELLGFSAKTGLSQGLASMLESASNFV